VSTHTSLHLTPRVYDLRTFFCLPENLLKLRFRFLNKRDIDKWDSLQIVS